MIKFIPILMFVCYLLTISFVNCLYSTKIAYHDSFTDEQIDFLLDKTNYLIDKCEPVQIYILARHGSRYPSHKQANESIEFLNKIKTHLLNENSLINEINEKVFKDKPHYGLTELGGRELRMIGKRFKERYPNLFDIETSKISIISSSKERSYESGTNFTVASLCEDDVTKCESLIKNIEIDDKMLRGFSHCDRYLRDVKDNDDAYKHLHLFKQTKNIEKLINDFKKRHYIDKKADIHIDEILTSAILCDIENTHRMELNWCKLFDENDFPLIEYLNDLKSYWIKGHGFKVNSHVVSRLLKDWLKEVDKFINDDPHKNHVLLRFGHAENIIPLISGLNLFKDEHEIKWDNFDKNKGRIFKSSKIAPFSSNVAFVLMKCNGDEYKIKLLVNELPVGVINAGRLFCNDDSIGKSHFVNSTCKYQDFINGLLESIDVYDEEMCDLKEMKDEL